MTKIVDNRPPEIARGIFCLRTREVNGGLATNPYLIVEGDEALLIDAGGRAHFSGVMLQLLQTAIEPGRIEAMIFHHYDPDLCGALYNFESVLAHPGLRIISHRANHHFLRYYGTRLPMDSLSKMNHRFRFRSGRELQFIETPFAHAPGSFVTFDPLTGTLFSSDLLGNDQFGDDFFYQHKTASADAGYLRQLVKFHERTMPSPAAFARALDRIGELPLRLVAPQHGALLRGEADCRWMLNYLREHAKVGCDLPPG